MNVLFSGSGRSYSPVGSGRGDAAGYSGLAGKAVLIAEDEITIAIEYASYLETLGATVVGPVTSVSHALAALRTQHLDAAVLDVDLLGSKSFAVADELMRRHIAFIFATGYDDLIIPDRFDAILRCQKPASPTDVEAALVRAIGNVAAEDGG